MSMLRSKSLKRALDFTLAAVATVVLAPLFLAVAVAILLEDGPPVLYRSMRVGKDRRPFLLYKFRSMVRGADAIGPAISGPHDLRITRVGRFIRATKLDELPQLFNVLRGDMSIIGPRPEVPEYVAVFSDRHLQTLSVRPGLSSPGALFYYFADVLPKPGEAESEYLERLLPAKLEHEMRYIERYQRCGILEDLRLMVITVVAIAVFPIRRKAPGAVRFLLKLLAA